MLYTSLTRAKEYLSITDNSQDALITDLIAFATDLIDSELWENIGARTIERRVDGTGSNRIVLPHRLTAISDIEYLKYTGNSSSVLIEDVDGFQVILSESTQRWRSNMRVKYQTGYTSVPTDIERVALELIVELKTRQKNASTASGAVKKKTIGDTTFEYAIREGTSSGYDAIAQNASVLKKYRPFNFALCS